MFIQQSGHKKLPGNKVKDDVKTNSFGLFGHVTFSLLGVVGKEGYK